MFHHVARAVPGRLLWYYDMDGLALFDALGRTFPELVALCLMPDHVHLILPHRDPDRRLHDVYQGFSHRRSARSPVHGALFAPRPPPVGIPDDAHLRRTIRYVHLNPCRKHLVSDPLAWPFSTHRDATGFAGRPIIEQVPDPARFHRFVSGDPTVDVAGTAFPAAPFEAINVERLAQAVAGVYRCADHTVRTRSAARRTLVHAAAWLEIDAADVRAYAGLSRSQHDRLRKHAPSRGARLYDPALAACVLASNDPRFRALDDVDRRTDRAWSSYRLRR